MSGHNKWSKIKHKKAATDSKKSKEFGKFSRLITMEVREAGGNTDSPGVKLAVERARKINMPSTNIDRAIKNALDKSGRADERIIYEMYGPGGSAVLIDIVTDSRNRTAAEIKHLLSKLGLALSKPGSAAWAFENNEGEWTASIRVSITQTDKDKLLEITEALEDHDDVSAVYTNVV